jgi:hypothetical protein
MTHDEAVNDILYISTVAIPGLNFYSHKGDKLVDYDAHEWRECVPLHQRKYVCIECGYIHNGPAMEFPRGGCRVRLAPLSWLPLKEQNSASNSPPRPAAPDAPGDEKNDDFNCAYDDEPTP